MKKSVLTTRKIVFIAMMAALTAAGSALRITMPLSIAGTTSFHLGNIMCALSGILLGPWFGGLAAGLGSAIYDMFNPLFIQEAWLTFLMKGVYGLCAGFIAHAGKQEPGYVKSVLASFAGAVSYALLYLIKSYFKAIWVQGVAANAAWIVLLDKLPATVFNGVVAVIFAPILAVAINKALKKNHLSLD
ncbi:MAG: ECF transporter S component [Firmicutes bacterium]|nr:ECF transporter S component [Bacillota bacterium]